MRALIQPRDRSQLLADTFCPGRSAVQQERHIGTEPHRQFRQPGIAPMQAPQLAAHLQRRSRIARTSAQSRTDRHPFLQMKSHPFADTRLAGKQPGGPKNEIFLLGTGLRIGTRKFDAFAGLRTEFVPVVDGLEQRCQFVLAVGSQSVEMQEQIDLGAGLDNDHAA